MAETWINHQTGQVEIRGDVNDPELAWVATQIGYRNVFRRGVYEVRDEIQAELAEMGLADGFIVTTVGGGTPDSAVRIGQVRVHHGDPSYPLYVMRRPRGRPPLYGETMIQTGVRLPREQIEWLKTKPEGISEYLRALIAREMEAEE
jgi:hypothetical protein